MRVDFYILQGEANRELIACRLCAKAYAQGHNVFVYVASNVQQSRFDDLLWTYQENSFVPHHTDYQEFLALTAPTILISQDTPPDAETGAAEKNFGLMINLSPAIPEFYTQFPRIAEIVNQNPEIKLAGRQRFSEYREQGCELQHHQL